MDILKIKGYATPEEYPGRNDAVKLHKALNAAEEAFYIAGIFTDQTALQHLSVEAVRAVSDFAKTNNALVRVDLQQCAVHGCADNIRKADVCDPKIARAGTSVKVSL